MADHCMNMSEKVAQWGEEVMGDNYSYVGAVVGATYPEIGKVLRKVMPKRGNVWQNCMRTAMIVLPLSLDTQMAAHRSV